MASRKKNHVRGNQANTADSAAVMERRLRPVYDCLDFGNYKKALQECEKLLKKHGETPCTKALKGLALVRLGKIEEGRQIVETVYERKPTDEGTLSVLTICYKELNQLDRIAVLYEHAVEEHPKSEDYLSHLFMAQVRIGEYKKQHHAAVKLHKLKPDNNPYYFWSVMSIVMQGVAGDERLSKTMFLPLAEKMCRNRQSNLTPVELSAETTLLERILYKQNKYDACLELFNSELGQHILLDDIFKQTRVAELLTLTSKHREAVDYSKTLLKQHPDQWDFYIKYLNRSQQLDQTEDSEDVLSFITEINSEYSESKTRSPHLVMLEYYTRKLPTTKQPATQLSSEQQSHYDSLLTWFLRYINIFGNKPCCYNDIEIYYTSLLENTVNKSELLEKIRLELKITDVYHQYENKKEIQSHILYLCLWRKSGEVDKLDYNEKMTFCNNLRQLFLTAAKTVEGSVHCSEVRTCDTYQIISSLTLVDLYMSTGDYKAVIQAVQYLEEGISISPSTHQMSLILVYLYVHLGVFGPVPALFSNMDIKLVLYEPMGHLIVEPAVSLLHWSSATVLFSAMLKFYEGSNREVCEGLISCYKYGTFSKVEELASMKHKLETSYQYTLIKTEQRLISLLCDSSSYDALLYNVSIMHDMPHTELNPSSLLDPRDLSLIDTYLPYNRVVSSDLQDSTFIEQKALTQLRYMTLRLICTSVLLSVSNGSGAASSLYQLLTELKSKYTKHLQYCSTITFKQGYILTLHESRLKSLTQNLLQSKLSDSFQVIHTIISAKLSSSALTEGITADMISSRITDITSNVNKIISDLQNTTPAITNQLIDYRKYREFIIQLNNVTEMLGFTTLLSSIIWRLYQPVRLAAQPRRRKKGAAEPAVPQAPECLVKSNPAVKQLISSMTGSLESLKKTVEGFLSDELVKRLSDIKISTEQDTTNCEKEKEVSRNIALSYERSAREVIELLNSKLLFINNLPS